MTDLETLRAQVREADARANTARKWAEECQHDRHVSIVAWDRAEAAREAYFVALGVRDRVRRELRAAEDAASQAASIGLANVLGRLRGRSA